MFCWKTTYWWHSIVLLDRATGFYQQPLPVNDQILQESWATVTHSEQIPTGLTQCRGLLECFPDLVSLPGDSLYEGQQLQYWSTTQNDLRPTCRITPTTSLETSQLIKYLNQHKLDVSVTSGGHSTIIGASNLNAGITLDLSALSNISISSDNSSVSFGSGTRWFDVYKKLDPYGLTVTGGQAGSVGTGGYLLGGGISILASRRGWSCDTLISIEVVLGNGSIVITNHTQHSDLFSAMKGAGSNFGIATSFTMSLLPAPSLQVSISQIKGEEFDRLAREISIFIEKSHEDPEVFLDLSIIPDSTRKSLVGYLVATRFGSIEDSPILSPVLEIPSTHRTLNELKPSEYAQTVDESNPYGFRYVHPTLVFLLSRSPCRHSVCTFTIRNDVATILAILSAVKSEFSRNDISSDDSYMPAMLLQTIYRAQLGSDVSSGRSRNALGLGSDTEPLIRKSLAVLHAIKNDHLLTLASHLFRNDMVTVKRRQAYREVRF